MSTSIHAFTDDALGDLDALAVAERIRTGEAGAEEVRQAAIDRARRVAELNAVQIACYDQAPDRVREGGPGVFAHVPSFIKDNTDVAGLPTRHGSAAFSGRPMRADSAPARQFLAQGFALLGKSTLPEFGLTASTEYVDRPATRNPWNTGRSAGASSGGSAVLVASGVVPMAHANDGGGSIRIPAAVNGLVGLKMTRARLLDQPGVRRLPINLVSEGVVTRTVRDTAHYLAAAERFHADLPPVGLVEGPNDRRLRIGLIRHDLLGKPVHPEIDAILTSAARTLEAGGHQIKETAFDFDPRFVEDFVTYWALFAILMSASFKLRNGRHFDPRRLDPFTKGLAARIRDNPRKVVPAVRRLRQGTRMYARQFSDVDVLLTPVLAHPAPKLGDHAPVQPFDELMAKLVDYVAFTPFSNIGGGPAIAVPHGMMSEGLPGSVQICAPHLGERTLLELAYELEAASPFPAIHKKEAPAE